MKTAGLTLAAASLVLLAGCAGRSAPDQRTAADTTSQRDPWICEPGATLDEWNCVRASAAPAGAGSAARLQQLLAQQNQKETEMPPAPTDPGGLPHQPDAPEMPDAPALVQTDLPDYLRLAFRPEQATSLLDLPGDYWTVQVIAMPSPEALEEYADANGLQGFSAARIRSNEEVYYVLLLGIYQTEEEARLALDSVPDNLAELSPWIRSVASLQRAMRAADAAHQT